ncbi:helix-turn-helix domain-containing protein [Streptomyces sp. NPDC096080]|uniref:helix-turn-helix domain-containing protein n=1 Tax=Streptomyces sp. NPDC096080 TaxID=3156693 RepID=UPI003330B29A
MSQSPGPTSVGQQLARRREELDLTQEAVARRVGISAPTVSVTERGHTQIRVSKRASWERALGLKPGTISRAYRDGAEIEVLDPPAPGSQEPVYADLTDHWERTAWEMPLSVEDRKAIIDALRRGAQGRSNQSA